MLLSLFLGVMVATSKETAKQEEGQPDTSSDSPTEHQAEAEGDKVDECTSENPRCTKCDGKTQDNEQDSE